MFLTSCTTYVLKLNSKHISFRAQTVLRFRLYISIGNFQAVYIIYVTHHIPNNAQSRFWNRGDKFKFMWQNTGLQLNLYGNVKYFLKVGSYFIISHSLCCDKNRVGIFIVQYRLYKILFSIILHWCLYSRLQSLFQHYVTLAYIKLTSGRANPQTKQQNTN